MGNNGKESKLNNFIVQGGILAFAGILVRMLGLLRRVPLTYIIGDVGNSYYSSAYEIYNIVLTISSYGIPLSVSKLIAQRVNKGQYRNANKLFKCALSFAFIVGAIASTVVFIFARPLSELMNEPMSMLALSVLAPTLLIVAVMGVFRGYFQGIGSMIPTAASQLIEQIVLIVVSLTASYLLSGYGSKVGLIKQDSNYKYAYGAAGATLGCAVGAGMGLLFLILLYKGYKKKLKKQIYRDPTIVIEDTFYVFKTLILTIVPVVLSNTVNNISNFLDQFFFKRIMGSKGLEEIKTVTWGVYSGKYSVLIGVPIAMANAMGASSVPTIAGVMKRKDYKEASDKISSVIRITMMISIPCAAGLFALAPSVMYLLFSETGKVGPILLRIGAFGVVFFSFSTLTNGILQGMSKLSKPIIHGLIALAIHITLLVILLKFTNLNIYAVALSNNVFSLIICFLNVLAISRVIGYRQEYMKTFVFPTVSAVLMGVIIFVLDKIFMADGYSRLFIGLEIIIGAFLYFVFLIAFKCITYNELTKLPGGSLIYRFLKKIHVMR